MSGRPTINSDRASDVRFNTLSRSTPLLVNAATKLARTIWPTGRLVCNSASLPALPAAVHHLLSVSPRISSTRSAPMVAACAL